MTTGYEVLTRPRLEQIPTKRAAWSDRTALLMAEMSKLAYRKFEVDADDESLPQDELDAVLARLLAGDDGPADPDAVDQPPPLPEEAITLRNELARGGFELAGLISDARTDTQAFLAISTARSAVTEPVAILSFRGTEKLKDWLTNIKIRQAEVRGTDIHEGFQGAFDSVKATLEQKVAPLVAAGRTLYLTGHSLGGALAIMATRELGAGSDSFGACYTFGSPRVGRFGFSRNIKTPIYRVVNANDIVPRNPPAYTPTVLQSILRIANIPLFGLLNAQIAGISKYVHYGDMRFLRRTKSSSYDDVRVLANPSVIYRFFWYWPALVANWRSPLENHSISLYCAKLAAYAECRNPPPE